MITMTSNRVMKNPQDFGCQSQADVEHYAVNEAIEEFSAIHRLAKAA
jgi:hypothetical protein